jgi:hypothetical protein
MVAAASGSPVIVGSGWAGSGMIFDTLDRSSVNSDALNSIWSLDLLVACSFAAGAAVKHDEWVRTMRPVFRAARPQTGASTG